MNVTSLRAFHAVALEGGFTRAASALGLSQPTLSSQVKLLEAQHEAALFDRKGRGVALTPLGQRLFDITARLFAAEDEARALLDGAKTLRRGHLRLAADSATHAMPALAALREKHAGLTFSMTIDNSTAVLQHLLSYRADVAISARNTSDPRIFSLPMRPDRLVLFAPKAHQLSQFNRVPIAALTGQDLVVREHGSITREVFEAALAGAGVKPGVLIEVQGREAVREAVAAGFGVGIVFAREFPDDPAFHVLDLEDVDLTVAEYAACLEQRRHLPMIRRFFEVLQGSTRLESAVVA